MSPMEARLLSGHRKPRLEVRAHISVPDMGNTPSRMLLNEDALSPCSTWNAAEWKEREADLY